jgi:selenium metabolism protein YedF
MVKELDCRNLDCPGPVLQTKKLLEAEAMAQIRVLVGNDAAVENVSRFLSFNGYAVSVDSDGITSAVEGTKEEADALKLKPSPAKKTMPGADPSHPQKIMIMISSTQMGKGNDDLGGKLMINFIKTLKEMGEELWRLVFVNHGVKLATIDSPVLEELQALEADNVDILVCGACLTFLELMEEKKVGQTTNMLDIVTSMQYADKVVNL